MKKFYDIIGSTGKVYGVWLEIENDKVVKYNCTCKWGSWFRWATANKGQICIHIKQAIKRYNEKK